MRCGEGQNRNGQPTVVWEDLQSQSLPTPKPIKTKASKPLRRCQKSRILIDSIPESWQEGTGETVLLQVKSWGQRDNGEAGWLEQMWEALQSQFKE